MGIEGVTMQSHNPRRKHKEFGGFILFLQSWWRKPLNTSRAERTICSDWPVCRSLPQEPLVPAVCLAWYFLLFQGGIWVMIAVLMLNHHSNWFAAPKVGAPSHKNVRVPCSKSSRLMSFVYFCFEAKPRFFQKPLSFGQLCLLLAIFEEADLCVKQWKRHSGKRMLRHLVHT